jgi:hypothetical protein
MDGTELYGKNAWRMSVFTFHAEPYAKLDIIIPGQIFLLAIFIIHKSDTVPCPNHGAK